MAPELVNLTIDGNPVRVPKGTLLIEACAQIGTYVPRFCYHEHLVPYAGCRMCLVDVEKMPKLATACSTPVGEGMVVHTANDKVRQAREGVLEFILVSHPLDCPVCDKGGECDLQDQTFLYGRPDSRVLDVKRFHQNQDLSATVKLDYNRCILCKRCVRFTEEVADDDRLIFRDRGAHTMIDTQTGEAFNSRFGGTVIEYCPVGALTDQVFRFRGRPWELKEKPSACGDCAMGCANTLHVRSNEVVRIFNREKEDLNGYYICDKGRFGHEFKDHPERVTQPMLRKDGVLAPVTWEEAIAWMAGTLRRIAQTDGTHVIAGIIGAESSLEDLSNFKALMDGIGSGNLDQWPPVQATPAQGLFFLNRAVPYRQVLDSAHLTLIDCHLFDELPMLALNLKQRHMGLVPAWGPQTKAKVRSITTARTLHSRYNWVNETVVPAHAQAALLIALAHEFASRGRLSLDLKATLNQASEAVSLTGLAPDRALVSELADGLMADDALLGIGSAPLLQDGVLLDLLELVIRCREAAKGAPLGLVLGLPAVNSAGALALGIHPRWDKRGPVGFGADALWHHITDTGDCKALILAGGDYAQRLDLDTLEALEQLDCFVAATFFLDEVTAQAHCVLPAATWYEASGLTCNSEGRLQEITRGTTPGPDIKPIYDWCAALGLALNLTVPARRETIIQQLEAAVPALHGLHEVNATTDRWRHPAPDAPLPELRRLQSAKTVSPRPEEFRLLLRRPFWVPGSRIEHSPALRTLLNPWQATMHPADAKRLGIKRGDRITLSTAQGHCTAPVVLTRGIPEGYVEVEVGHAEGRIAGLGEPVSGVLSVTVDRASQRAGVGEVAATS